MKNGNSVKKEKERGGCKKRWKEEQRKTNKVFRKWFVHNRYKPTIYNIFCVDEEILLRLYICEIRLRYYRCDYIHILQCHVFTPFWILINLTSIHCGIETTYTEVHNQKLYSQTVYRLLYLSVSVRQYDFVPHKPLEIFKIILSLRLSFYFFRLTLVHTSRNIWYYSFDLK